MTFQLTQRMAVYQRASGSGAFTVLLEADVPCRLFDVNRNMAATGPDRSELAEHGNLHFAPDFTMPEPAQIEVIDPSVGSLGRFNLQASSIRPIAPFGSNIQWRADVVRARGSYA